MRQCEGILTQQRQVSRSSADGLNHKQHPADGGIRAIGLCAAFQNHRHQGIKSFTTFARKSLIEAAVTDAGQQRLDLLRVFKAKRLELCQLILGCERFIPQIRKERFAVVGVGLVFVMEYAAKESVDVVVDRGDSRLKGGGFRIPHCQRDTRPGQWLNRNRMSLGIIHDLEAVFEYA